MLKILLQNEAGININFVMYLKQINKENQLHISEKPKEGFNDTVFQHLLVELKEQYFCVYVQYMWFVMLPFRMNQGAGFPIQETRVQNHWVAPRLT